MYIFKNALKTITRNKGRNILMAIIIIVIACASAVTLSIKKAANTIIDSYSNKYDVVASIGINRENLMKPSEEGSTNVTDAKEAFNNIEQLSIEDIEKYGDSKYVKSYYYTYSISMNSSNIEKATSDTTTTRGPGNMGNSADFNIEGYSSYDSMTNFINGKYTITEGEVNSDFTSNTCVINSELATYNNLKVGDTIKLEDPNDEDITYDLKITGIFTEKSSDDASTNMDMFSNSANRIITNATVVSNIVKLDGDLHSRITPAFILTVTAP